jgi:amidase
MHDLWRLDASAQAALVREGHVTPRELLDAAIARIEQLNPAINAVITPLFELAAEQAAGPMSGPFAGVPLLLKDASLEVEGTPHYAGVGAMRDAGNRSTHTTDLARRLRAAGFVFMGKTNVPALSAGITTEPSAFGPARNPWDTGRTVGGSSGGSAAAVACGMTAIAHGGDATGSLRYPAACCGVATLKPTRGRVPSVAAAGQPDAAQVWAEFVLTRSVRDLAGVLAAVGDAPSHVDGSPHGKRALRIGLLPRDVMTGGAVPTEYECSEAVLSIGQLLTDMGHEVEEAHPPALDGLFVRTVGAMQTFGVHVRRAQMRWLAERIGREPTAADVDGDYVSEADAAAISPEQTAEAAATLERETAPVAGWWREHDVLVTPTTRQPAWPLGSGKGVFDAGAFPPPFSFTGQPAASLPLAVSSEGLPIGIQLVGAYGRDEELLELCAALEAARPWAERWPEVGLAVR